MKPFRYGLNVPVCLLVCNSDVLLQTVLYFLRPHDTIDDVQAVLCTCCDMLVAREIIGLQPS
jgi:hypothetical protein